MKRRTSVGTLRFITLLAVLLLASGVLVMSASGASDGGVAVEQIESEVDVDDVLLAIDIEDDGDAEWTIEYLTRLDTDDREAAFEELQADIEEDPEAYTETFEDRMVATAADASEVTGREMAVTEMSIRAERRELPREYGVITYTFRWSNFAAVDGDELTAGDAIDGLFLDDDSELRIGWSDEWDRADATPPPTELRDDAVVWQGPTSFAGGEPRLRLVPAGSDEAVSDDDTEGGNGDGTTDGATSDGDVSATTVALLAVLLAVVFVALAARRGRLPNVSVGPTASGDGEASPSTGEAAGDAAAASTTTDAATASATTDEDGATADSSQTDADEDDEDDEDRTKSDDDAPFGAGVDPDLLSNEEKVLKLIEANGGRMKQKRVAEELDWTAAKTSQVTKGLREEGELKGFRLGRENVLALPEEDPR